MATKINHLLILLMAAAITTNHTLSTILKHSQAIILKIISPAKEKEWNGGMHKECRVFPISAVIQVLFLRCK